MRLALPAPPLATAFYRMLFAGVALAGLLWLPPLRRRRGARARLDARRAATALAAGACFGTDLGLWHLSLVETSVANATLLVNTTPLPIGLYAVLVLRQRLRPTFVSGAALSLGGAALLLGVESSRGGSLLGEGLALGAALFYSGYLLLLKSVRTTIDAPLAVLLATIGATAVLGVYALALGQPLSGFPAHSWWVMGAAALVSQLGGVMGIAWALRYLHATFASVALLAQPLTATLLAWWLFGETLGPLQALGGIAVLVGIFAASRGGADPDAVAATRGGADPDAVSAARPAG